MIDLSQQWCLPDPDYICPEAWVRLVAELRPDPAPHPPIQTAQLLWQRGWQDRDQLAGFLNPAVYQPAGPEAFGEDMVRAVERLQQAQTNRERVAIWGDFDADGVTATAVLWEGLEQVFPHQQQLRYYIPNRLRESHGLSIGGIDQLRDWGTTLIVTCDTGSTNLVEIEYARQSGIDLIVTDHHTLPDCRPPVVAMINPRTLPLGHPLGTLSGVAVAYKLVEALYATLPQPPEPGLESLLDLVAIGLIADLVELTQDCRYLAQLGLRQLQTHLQPGSVSTRPGIAELLTLCRRTGDRPSDISFGLGPRINAVSRIHGDASFCVELLTSRDPIRCKTLALEAELANSRRQALQRDVLQQATAQVEQLDLSTTQVIVLTDEQWPVGILGLVAGQLSQQYGRPTVLLRPDPPNSTGGEPRLARGSARSVRGLDLYDLFQTQAHMLTGFGGHPMAAGLTLPVAHIPLFATALNRVVREILGAEAVVGPRLDIDLVVTVSQLGQDLFRDLKLLEPYGMGNPVPKLLVRDAWFEKPWHRSIRDQRGGKVGYIRTEFQLWDRTSQTGFPGEWWGHYKDELPAGRCDVVVELDYSSHPRQVTYAHNYLVRLVAVRTTGANSGEAESDRSLDANSFGKDLPSPDDWLTPVKIPNQGMTAEHSMPPVQIWTQLVGLAKYLHRTGETATLSQLRQRLCLSDQTLTLGLRGLHQVGFELIEPEQTTPLQVIDLIPSPETMDGTPAVHTFLEAVQEEQFRQRYRSQSTVATIDQNQSDPR